MQLPLDTCFADVDGLGLLVSRHPISRSDRFGTAFLSLVCFGSALVMLNLMAERTTLASNTDSPVFVNTDPLFMYWPAVAGVVLLLAGAWLLFAMVRNWNTAAALYEHGAALSGPAGLRQFRWDAVDQVFQSITNYYRNGALSNTVYVYTVRTHDGQILKFDSRFVQVKELGEAIQRNATVRLLPRYVQALNSGQRLAFGPLAVDREGLHAGQQSLPWAEIKAVKIQAGSLTIESVGGDGRTWKPVSVAQLPNLWVFYQIVGSLTTIA
jgi:hypothetical protein